MKKIPSFTINHEKLLRGIYVSRKDEVGGEVVTTFDIRMKEPNREPVLHNGAIHAMEHLAATYLRNDPEWKERVIYWGPMGCLTGNYLLLRGDLESRDIVDLMIRTFRFVADYEGIYLAPGLAIAVTTCSMTCLWPSGSRANSSPRCSRTSSPRTSFIQRDMAGRCRPVGLGGAECVGARGRWRAFALAACLRAVVARALSHALAIVSAF